MPVFRQSDTKTPFFDIANYKGDFIMDKEKTVKKDNITYVINFGFGSQKIEDLLFEYLSEKVREEISEKERVSG